MEPSSVDVLSFDDFLQEKQTTPVVDVRNRDEIIENGQIPGTFCVPLPEVELAFQLDPDAFKEKYGASKPSSSSPLILTCRSGRRTFLAADLLKPLGYTCLKSYKGSFIEWTEKGADVIKPGKLH